MESQSVDYKDTLNKMANLEELSKFIVAQNAALEGKRSMLVKTLTNMQGQVSKIRDQLDNIKSKGTTASSEIKQLISDSDTKQAQSLKNIKNSIGAMLNMDKLETSVKNLEGDINSLAGVAGTGTNPGAPEFKPTGPVDPAAQQADKSGLNANAKEFKPANMKGGYTYGKSRRSGKGRRKRRTKKMHRKGARNY